MPTFAAGTSFPWWMPDCRVLSIQTLSTFAPCQSPGFPGRSGGNGSSSGSIGCRGSGSSCRRGIQGRRNCCQSGSSRGRGSSCGRNGATTAGTRTDSHRRSALHSRNYIATSWYLSADLLAGTFFPGIAKNIPTSPQGALENEQPSCCYKYLLLFLMLPSSRSLGFVRPHSVLSPLQTSCHH